MSAQTAQDMRQAVAGIVSGKQVPRLYISSACPAAVEYIKLYEPTFAPLIMDRASPLLAHARLLRQLFGPTARVVFLGPCIAKKREADAFQEIDGALTFQELRDWMEAEGLRPDQFSRKTPAAFVPRRAAKGSLYPIEGGMIDSWRKYAPLPEMVTMAVSGLDAIKSALEQLDVAALDRPLFLELLSCEGGASTAREPPESTLTVVVLQIVEYYDKWRSSNTAKTATTSWTVPPWRRNSP
jgi:iron only hydrogenase large subunit-like protein